jgi:hypothetical protein
MEKSAQAGRLEDSARNPDLSRFTTIFNTFLEDKDINQLESDLKADLRMRHLAVKEFTASLESWLQSGERDPPFDLALTFFHREMAVLAREEATLEYDQLL